MRHNHDRRALNRTASHRKAMLRNMVTSLFKSERIRTTTAKAKEARRVAEHLITFAKRGDISARRQAAKTVKNKDVLRKLFDDIGPRFADRQGGYTRILRLVNRPGDNADMVLLELLKADEKKRGKKKSMKKYHKVDIPDDPTAAQKKESGKEDEKAQPQESDKEEKPDEEDKKEQPDKEKDKPEEKEEVEEKE